MLKTGFILAQDLIQIRHVVLLIAATEPVSRIVNFFIQLRCFHAAGTGALSHHQGRGGIRCASGFLRTQSWTSGAGLIQEAQVGRGLGARSDSATRQIDLGGSLSARSARQRWASCLHPVR